MGKTLMFELIDEIYGAIQQMAAKSGEPTEMAVLKRLIQHTPKMGSQLTHEEAEAARQRFRRHFGVVNSGNPRSADNEQIDADLVTDHHFEQEEFVKLLKG